MTRTRMRSTGNPSNKLPPAHPGEVLNEDFLKPLGLTAEGLGQAIGVSGSAIRQLVRGHRTGKRKHRPYGISMDLALRLARYFGTSAELWLNLQRAYEFKMFEQDIAFHRIIRDIVPHPKKKGVLVP